MSKHATKRCQQRGVDTALLQGILEHADIERPVGRGCWLLRVHKSTARALTDDRLGRYAILWSDRTGTIVTVLPIHKACRGNHYRRTH